MFTPATLPGAFSRERLPARFIPLRRRKRVNPSRPRAVCACAVAVRDFRQRPTAIKMLPTWLAVATIVNAPAAQIAIVMPQLCHEGRDTHVTGGPVDVMAAQHHSVSWHILGARSLACAD